MNAAQRSKKSSKQSEQLSQSLQELSQHSIVSDDHLNQHSFQNIKQRRNFVQVIAPAKYSYNTGTLLNSGEVPPQVGSLQGGLIIQMPLEGIDAYLKDVIDLKSLLNDDSLCQYLEQFLNNFRKSKLISGSTKDKQSTQLIQTGFLSLIQNSRQLNSNHLQESNPYLKPREAKLAHKRLEIVRMYMEDQLKPKQISKKLRVTAEFVSRTVEKFKHELKTKVLHPQEPKKSGKRRERDNEQLVAAVGECIEEVGIYQCTGRNIHNRLQEMKTSLPLKYTFKVPCISTIHKILKEQFHLKFGKTEAANVKYRDPAYNGKRLWVSRLLSQFLSEDAVIISVDESNFRSDYLPPKQWALNQKSILGKRKNNESKFIASKKYSRIIASDKELQYGEMLLGKSQNHDYFQQSPNEMNAVPFIRASNLPAQNTSQGINLQATAKDQQSPKNHSLLQSRAKSISKPHSSNSSLTKFAKQSNFNKSAKSSSSSKKSVILQTPPRQYLKAKQKQNENLSPIPEVEDSPQNQSSTLKKFRNLKLQSTDKESHFR